MAPQKGTKRVQQAKGGAAVKKQKVENKFTPIIKGLQQADCLGTNCCQMLVAAVPHCLGTPSDLRSDAHHAFVNMISEALHEVEVTLQQEVDAHKAKVDEAEDSKSTLKEKLADAEETLAKSTENMQSKKATVEEKSSLLSQAKATLQEKVEVQKAGYVAFDKANNLKDALEKAVHTDLKPITAGEFNIDDANAHYNSLKHFLNDLKLDDSLKSAAPVTCVKPKDQRGAFDDVVIEQLEKAFASKADEFSAALEEAVAQKAECDSAVEEAETRVKDAEALSQAATSELDAAQTAMREASDGVTMAESNLAAHEVERLSIVGEHEAKAAVLSDFTVYNKGNFELLRDQVSKAASAPQEKVDMQDAEGSVEQVPALPSKMEAIQEEITQNVPIEVGGA